MLLLRLFLNIAFVLCLMVCGNAVAARTHHHVKAKPAAAQQVAATVNINEADAASLATLNGVGPKKAEAIVAYRNQHGKFKSVEDLTAVKGIGSKFLARLQKRNPGKIVAQ